MVGRHTNVVSILTLHYCDDYDGVGVDVVNENNFTVDYQATAHSSVEKRKEQLVD